MHITTKIEKQVQVNNTAESSHSTTETSHNTTTSPQNTGNVSVTIGFVKANDFIY